MPRPAKLNRINLTGNRYGRLLIIDRGENKPGLHSRWNYICDCGNLGSAKSCHLLSGAIKSCGCMAGKTHGRSGGRQRKAPEYHSWQSAKQRCNNPNNVGFRWYGGRGIQMCSRWQNSFAAFYADMGPRPAGTTIDRIDSDGHYEPGNCRWATKAEQTVNQRKPFALNPSNPTTETTLETHPIGPDHAEPGTAA